MAVKRILTEKQRATLVIEQKIKAKVRKMAIKALVKDGELPEDFKLEAVALEK